jgi:hypothetical protein
MMPPVVCRVGGSRCLRSVVVEAGECVDVVVVDGGSRTIALVSYTTMRSRSRSSEI